MQISGNFDFCYQNQLVCQLYTYICCDFLFENYQLQNQSFYQSLMNFHRQNASSSFTPYCQLKSGDSIDQDFQIQQFCRLSLNSHHSSSGNRSLRSNASFFFSPNPTLIMPLKSSDSLSLGSRKRKGSIQLEWKNSIIGNMTFLNKSIAGKSSLCRHEQFNLHYMQQPQLHKQLSEKSCPVGSDQTDNLHSLQKISKACEEGQIFQHNFGRSKFRKKFLKTKNLLRNLSSYLHKHIKYNGRCKKFIKVYLEKKNPQMTQTEKQNFIEEFIDWTSSLYLPNFQEYQRVWDQQNIFTSIYRQICYKYYREDLFCDIQSSRLSSKQVILEYIPQFIQGLINPKQFTHFQNQ